MFRFHISFAVDCALKCKRQIDSALLARRDMHNRERRWRLLSTRRYKAKHTHHQKKVIIQLVRKPPIEEKKKSAEKDKASV